MTTIDPATLQNLLQQVTEAAKAAADASKRSSSSSTSTATGVDWSKLLTKPGNFDHKSMDEEIKHFRDWSWQLVQYVGAIDSGYTKEMEDLAADPTKPMDMSTASAATRERSSKLYGLLAGLLKNRALQTLKSVGNGDGYEGWRQLLLSLRPTSKNRGLAIMSAVMSWSSFQMGAALQPQLLKLEEAFDEAKRAGVAIQEEVKVAVVLRCLSGALRTHVSLQLSEGMTYMELRECLVKWDRAQQRWSHLVSTDDSAMEVDRIEKGKGKKGTKDGKGKNSSKGKSNSGYNKSKGKGNSQNSSKGKGKKSDGKGKGYSNSSWNSWSSDNKGKGKQSANTEARCWKCDGKGHYARDCKVRAVQEEHVQPEASPQSTVTRTPSASTPSTPAQGVQFRVARIMQDDTSHVRADVPVFDMREQYSSEESAIRVVKFYIGEEDEAFDEIRVMIEEVPPHNDSNDLTSILIDSGADTAVFPSNWMHAGITAGSQARRLQDAQGNLIPTRGRRDVEIFLPDLHGNRVCLRERVTISDAVTQPILCYGRLMQQGWDLNAADQTLRHAGYGISIPLEMQNCSLAVQGSIRMISERPHHVRLMKAMLDERLTDLPHGWSRRHGFLIGFHMSKNFINPLMYDPNLVEHYRTTLIQFEDGHWELIEICERISGLVFEDNEFEDGGMRNVITICTSDYTPPEDMGFTLEGELDFEAGRQDEMQEAEMEVPIAPDEDAVVESAAVQHQPDAQESAEPMDQIVIEGFDPEGIVVNGVELNSESSLKALRQACSFHNISTSGSRVKCYKRLVNYMKAQELEAAREAASMSEKMHYRDPLMQVEPKKPSDAEVAKHNLTHIPFQNWCPHCVAFRSRPDRHERNDLAKDAQFPTISFDFCFTKAVGDGEDDKTAASAMWMVMCDNMTGYVGCVPLRSKNQVKLAVCELMAFTQNAGHHAVTYLCDNEPSVRSILRALINARHSLGLPTRIQTSKVGDHSNALAENSVARIRQLAGSYMDQLHTHLNMHIGTTNGLWSWAARHAAWTLSRYKAVRGATPYELVYGKPFVGTLLQFAEPCFAYVATAAKGMKKWIKGIFLGKTEGQDAFIVYDGSKVLLTRSTRRISQSWGLSLAYYKDFSCPTYDFQTGFGARIVPTKREALALPASDAWIPLEAIAAKAKDPDAEAVIKKAIEESREEKELEMMGKFDKRDHVVMAEDDVEATPQAPVEETPPVPMAIAVPSSPEGAGAEP